MSNNQILCYEWCMLDVYKYEREMNWWTICNRIAKTLGSQ